jgi:tRNA threonylcarbamoyladenosine biosynthesis protein TsaB
MALLLNIDTATSFASVGFSRDGILLDMLVNDAPKEHASFLQPAIARLSAHLDIALTTIDAIAVTIGPGSYTGLRVGLSSAKGLAYALGKPIVPVNTLAVMARAAEKAWSQTTSVPLFCPMIDARREEVFTAIYSRGGQVLMEPGPLILSASVFDVYLKDHVLIFTGDGHLKWEPHYQRTGARFLRIQHSVVDLAELAEERFGKRAFGDLAYLEPLYLKEFHKNS